jgi:hypothetical protein
MRILMVNADQKGYPVNPSLSTKWSYSSLKDYINCPKQYHEVKVLKRYTKSVTKQMRYGTEVHAALEDYVRDGTPLKKNYEQFKPLLDALLQIEGERYPEHRMALTNDLKPCSFGAQEYWVRGIADLMVIDQDHGYIVDYKTGSNRYPDMNQLKLMALMAFAHFPELVKVKAGLLFVMHNSFINDEFKREDEAKLWDSFKEHLMRLQNSFESGTWQANPTPLCGWCPVDSCEFHRGK